MSSTVLLLTALVLLLAFLVVYRVHQPRPPLVAADTDAPTYHHSLSWLIRENQAVVQRAAARTEPEWDSLTVYDPAEAERLLDSIESAGYPDRVVVYDRDGSCSVYWR